MVIVMVRVCGWCRCVGVGGESEDGGVGVCLCVAGEIVRGCVCGGDVSRVCGCEVW